MSRALFVKKRRLKTYFSENERAMASNQAFETLSMSLQKLQRSLDHYDFEFVQHSTNFFRKVQNFSIKNVFFEPKRALFGYFWRSVNRNFSKNVTILVLFISVKKSILTLKEIFDIKEYSFHFKNVSGLSVPKGRFPFEFLTL